MGASMDAKPAQPEPDEAAATPQPPSLLAALKHNQAPIAAFAAGVFALLWLGAEVTIARLEKENAALQGKSTRPFAELGAPAPATDTPSAPSAPRAADARTLTHERREAMLQILHEQAADGRAWFVKERGDPEADAYAESLASAFRTAGWSVEVDVWTNGTLKPGVRVFVGPEEAPPAVELVSRALEAGGVLAQQFLGYRAYRAERIRAGAGAAGIDLRDDQAFVIVVGRAE
jgi:hypothetical protein